MPQQRKSSDKDNCSLSTPIACARQLDRAVRTTNGLERINREIKRRTRVALIFPNTASCLHLVSA
ncbi:transposase [Paraburkholderia sp. RL17-373-BIF-A]|uniref:transposase n=1 Tax=Paraburkholderia sp. RL17-373-BIF-A TaxID=3031629 RepID=UPI0038BB6DC8